MIYTYNKYIEYIKEGLIFTHNIEKYYGSLDIELNSIGIRYIIDIQSKFLYDLTLFDTCNIDNGRLKYVIDLNQNLLGYYPSFIWVKNKIGWNGFKFDIKYLNNKYKEIKIRFESKYDNGIYKNDTNVPKISYHLSPSKNRERISDIGLYPKSGSRKTYHMDRIYLFYDLVNYSQLLKSLKYTDNNKYYDLYEIELDNNYIIHTDPNYINGFYTYDNIRPEYIKLLKSKI